MRRTEIIRASADASGLWMKMMHMCFHAAAITEPRQSGQAYRRAFTLAFMTST